MELQPLIWGRYTTAGSISGYRGLLPAFINRRLAHWHDIFYAWLFFRNVDCYTGARGDRVCKVALGYFISVRK